MLSFALFILTLWAFIKTFSYGIFEVKKNSNKTGGIVTIIIAIISLVFPNVVVYINGFY